MFKRRCLVFEDGPYYEGYRLGSDQLSIGEIVFNIAMTGYQETISDSSYTGRTVTSTYPLIGNYGINRDGFESFTPILNEVVAKEASTHPSDFRKQEALHEVLVQHYTPGISRVDTRSITGKIRKCDVLEAGFTGNKEEIRSLTANLRTAGLPRDEVTTVSTKTPYVSAGSDLGVMLLDSGGKQSIVKELNSRGCSVTVVPYDTSTEEILAMSPGDVMLSNGPGDPEEIDVASDIVKGVLGNIPFFGTCLSHQLFILSQNVKAFKVKSGHRDAGHPVRDLHTGKVDITSQNHGYTINKGSLKNTGLEVTHIALNDGTVEGLRHETSPTFSMQYHPEVRPGPSDSDYLFDEFLDTMRDFKDNKKESKANA